MILVHPGIIASAPLSTKRAMAARYAACNSSKTCDDFFSNDSIDGCAVPVTWDDGIESMPICKPSRVEGMFHRERGAEQPNHLEADRLNVFGRGISDLEQRHTCAG